MTRNLFLLLTDVIEFAAIAAFIAGVSVTAYALWG